MDISIKKKLQGHDIRPTKIRMDVLKIFLGSDHALSHSDIENQLRKNFDRVTLYRTLDMMDKKGLIHKITDDLGITKYALCIDDSCIPNQHKCEHVHFKCIECGNIYCLHPGNIPKIKLPESYTIQTLAISAKGICENCNI